MVYWVARLSLSEYINLQPLDLQAETDICDSLLAVNIPPVSNIHHQHNQHGVADLIDNAVIPNAHPVKLLVPLPFAAIAPRPLRMSSSGTPADVDSFPALATPSICGVLRIHPAVA